MWNLRCGYRPGKHGGSHMVLAFFNSSLDQCLLMRRWRGGMEREVNPGVMVNFMWQLNWAKEYPGSNLKTLFPDVSVREFLEKIIWRMTLFYTPKAVSGCFSTLFSMSPPGMHNIAGRPIQWVLNLIYYILFFQNVHLILLLSIPVLTFLISFILFIYFHPFLNTDYGCLKKINVCYLQHETYGSTSMVCFSWLLSHILLSFHVSSNICCILDDVYERIIEVPEDIFLQRVSLFFSRLGKRLMISIQPGIELG